VNTREAQKGSTLAEVLVVALLACCSAVSTGSAILRGLSSVTSSLHHQQAARLNSDLAAVVQGIHAEPATSRYVGADQHCDVRACNPEEFLQHAIQRWQSRAQTLLPGATTKLTPGADNGLPTLSATLKWLTDNGAIAQATISIPLTPRQ